jgi:phosphatidylserine decarboxylase
MDEYTNDEINRWRTFNDFFSRKIDRRARPIEKAYPKSIISPCDARIICFQQNKFFNIYSERKDSYRCKKKFIITDFIPYINDYDEFIEGSGFVCRLAPQDYHHFHSPHDMIIDSMQLAGDSLYSVNPIMDDDVYEILNINFLNDNFKIILHCTSLIYPSIKFYYIIIGAALVGSIKFNYRALNMVLENLIKKKSNKYHSFSPRDPIIVKAGDDMGSFYYGGSTVAVLFNCNLSFDYDLLYFSTYDENKQRGGILFENDCVLESRILVNQHLALIE